MSAANLANLPVVAGADTALIVLDPEGAGNGPEAVLVTAHTSSATTATITRAAETGGGLKSTGQAHASGTKWVHALSVADFTGGTPAASAPGDAAVTGSSGQWADKDHKHAREAWGLVGDVHASAPGDAAAAGATGKVADAGHTHAREAWGLTGDLAAVGTAAAAGASGKVADAAHVHVLGTGAVSTAGMMADGIVTVSKLDPALIGDYLKLQSAACDLQTTITAQGLPAAVPDTIHGTTVTLPCTRSGQLFLCWGFTDVTYTAGSGGGNEAVSSLSVDDSNTLTTPWIIGKDAVTGVTVRVTLGQMWVVSGLSVASHTFRLKACKASAVDTFVVNATHTQLNVLRIG
jgi:hypothetical protein